jgi:hypothetical protein
MGVLLEPVNGQMYTETARSQKLTGRRQQEAINAENEIAAW